MIRPLLASAAVAALLSFGLAGCAEGAIPLGLHHVGAGVPPTGCASPSATPGDGCDTQVAGAAIQDANFFIDVAQSGQTLQAGLATWAQPGIHTPIGPTLARAFAVDPGSSSAFRPAGCSVTHSGTDYQSIDCSSPAAFTWPVLELGPINGHGPTFTQFHNSTANAQVFSGLYFTEPSSCVSSPYAAIISVQSAASAAFTVKNFDIDMNGVQCAYVSGLNAIAIFTSGDITIQNGRFTNSGSRNISVGGGVASHIKINGTFHYGLGFNNGAHGELDTIGTVDGGPLASLDISFNTGVSTAEGAATNTTLFYLTNGVSGNLGSFNFDHNIMVTNKVGGASAVLAGTLGWHIDNGSGAGGNIVTVDSMTGTLAPGSLISGTNGTGSLVLNLMTNLTPGNAGVGSRWLSSCQQSASGSCPPAMGGFVSSGPVDIPQAFQTGLNGSIDNHSTGPCMEMAHSTYGAPRVTNNLCGNAGGTGHFTALGKVSQPISCTAPVVLTGNKDLITGLAANTLDATFGGC